MVMITADSSTNTSETMSYDNGSSLRDDSFSSYSNDPEDTFVLHIQDSTKHFNSFPSISGRKKTEYGEIGVYRAEKYFNDQVNEAIPKADKKVEIRSGTPSVCSELSSNSQSSLLKIPRNHNPRKVNATRTKKFLSRLGMKCSCNDKDSVNIDDNARVRKPKESPETGNRLSRDRSNISLQEDKRFPGKVEISNKLHLQEDKIRKSSEVFGSPIAIERGKSFSHRERQSTGRLSWDLILPRPREVDDIDIGIDTGSDASSDLFEIESLSTICYAPSEANMEWSSGIANAAYFSTIPDEREVKATITKTSVQINVLDGKTVTGKQIPEEAYRTRNNL